MNDKKCPFYGEPCMVHHCALYDEDSDKCVFVVTAELLATMVLDAREDKEPSRDDIRKNVTDNGPRSRGIDLGKINPRGVSGLLRRFISR